MVAISFIISIILLTRCGLHYGYWHVKTKFKQVEITGVCCIRLNHSFRCFFFKSIFHKSKYKYIIFTCIFTVISKNYQKAKYIGEVKTKLSCLNHRTNAGDHAVGIYQYDFNCVCTSIYLFLS